MPTFRNLCRVVLCIQNFPCWKDGYMELVTFFNKWLHLISIVGVLGGTAFGWLVMVPALRNEAEDNPLAKGMWKRFGLSLAVLWVIVLLTGFANMAFVSPKVNANYQMLLGIKMSGA